MDGRAEWVDFAKGIGIVLVVYSHVSRGVLNANIVAPETALLLVDSLLYSFHMPLFFFLSGLLFRSSVERRGTKQLLYSKVDSILYPYILWSLLQGFLEVALSDLTNGNVSVKDVLALLWQPRSQFWFLYTLFTVFCISALVERFVEEKHRYGILLLGVLLYILPIPPNTYWIVHYISENFVFFYLGVIIGVSRNYFDGALPVLLPCTVLIFCAGQWWFHFGLGYRYEDRGIMSLMLALSGIAVVCQLSMWVAERGYGIIRTLGLASMAIYLMHILAGAGARIISIRVFGIDSWAWVIAISVVVGVFVPLAMLRVSERYKIPFLFSAPLSAGVQGCSRYLKNAL